MSGRTAALERLRHAGWLEKAAPFFEILDGRKGMTRVVGGIVRDTLLGADGPDSDLDMATVHAPETVAERALAAGFAVHPTGIAHGTVTLVANGTSVQVTTLRQDVETFGRRARVIFGSDWQADARRRDFTMNALYAEPDGALFDPLEGLGDCLMRRVRFIGEAQARIAEDRLRVYRYFRFCATHGEQRFEPDAIAACAAAAGALHTLSAERIGAEMLRLLGAPRCAATVEKMVEIGVLGADMVPPSILPALRNLETDDGPIDAVVRMALLVAGGVPVGHLQQRWRLPKAMCRRVEALVQGARLARGARIGELAYRFSGDAREAVAVAAALEGWPPARRRALQEKASAIGPGVFPLRGKDLVGSGLQGEAVGRELRRLEKLWIESGFRLDKQALLDRVRLS